MGDSAPHAATNRALPFQQWAWLTPEKIGLVASALGTAALLAGGATPFAGSLRTWNDRGELAGMVVPFTVAGVAAAWIGLRAPSPSTAVTRTIGAGAAATAIMLPCLMALLQNMEHAESSIGGFLFAAGFGGAAGAALAAPTSIVVRAVVRSRTTPSHDGQDRILSLAGAYVAIMAGISVLIGRTLGSSSVLVAVGIIGLLGVVAMLFGTARLLRRMLWLRRIEQGREPTLERMAVDPEATRGLEPLLLEEPGPTPWAIVRHSPGQGYRTGRADVPIALAPAATSRAWASLLLSGLRAVVVLAVVSSIVGALELACVGCTLSG